jgi:hypothetical protein
MTDNGGDMVSKLGLPWRLVVSLVLGGMTWGVLGIGEAKLPYAGILNNIVEMATLPALAIARIFYPAGVHTGLGAPYYGYAVLASGILFYTVVWFIILSWFNHRARRLATTRSDRPTMP